VAIIQGNRHLLVNRRFVEIFGFDSPAELEGLPIDRIIHPEDRERVAEFNRKRQAGEEVPKRYEFQGLRKDGKSIFAEVSAARTSFRGEMVSLVFIRDITGRRQVEEKIRLMAFHDSLTGLPNRTLFNDRFQTAEAQARRTGQALTLMMIDLDHFKTVNDTLGHEAGDRLLHEVAGRLQMSIRQMDTVARLGGDEFIILLPGVGGRDDICKTADRLLRQGQTSLVINGRQLSLTLSIGIAVYPGNGEDLKTLMHQADAAMYRVKQTGRNRYCFADEFFEPERAPIRKVGRAGEGKADAG
jgi:diguanylate cyclase (GGDEF)-like protein/PAS domain S-box-containing protein